MKIGLIGAGRIGKVHAHTVAHYVDDAHLVAVADNVQSAADALAQKYHAELATQKYKDILKRKDIDAVIIASPTDTHAKYITEAAQVGKHIFCEKPIAADLPAIDAALTAVEKAGVKLQIGFNRRFDSNFSRIKKAIDSGEIGTLQLLHIISRDPSPPPIEYIKVSGGLFFDMTIHDFDMARFLCGDVEEIYATGGVLVDRAIGEAGDIDTAIVTLKFKNGALGTIDNSRRAVYGYDQRVEVFGSGGSAKCDNLYENYVQFNTSQAVKQDLPLHFFMERYTQSYQIEVQAFVDCILSDTPAPVSGGDGRVPVVMAMAAQKSFEENRPVQLREIEA